MRPDRQYPKSPYDVPPPPQTELAGLGAKRPEKRKRSVPLQPGLFAEHCERRGIPRPTYQARIHPTRGFIYDFAWPKAKIALEVDGGLWADSSGRRGAHGSVSGIISDMEKSNETQLAGILMLRVPFPRYLDPETFTLVKRAFVAVGLAKRVPKAKP